jgi:type IV pilus assembly protein PilE
MAADNAATPPNFTITFTATGTQASDGNLTLNSEGVKTPAEEWK